VYSEGGYLPTVKISVPRNTTDFIQASWSCYLPVHVQQWTNRAEIMKGNGNVHGWL